MTLARELRLSSVVSVCGRIAPAAAPTAGYDRGVTVSAQSLNPVSWWQGLGRLTRSGSSVEGLSWALYDFANTIFSFAIVSFAMGPWTTDALGETNGTVRLHRRGQPVVALNAAVSPVLGAMSDRTGGRKRYLAVFTDRLHRADPGDRPGQHLARPPLLRHRQLRLPGRADLLRRAAPRRRAAGRPRTALAAWGWRSATWAASSPACCSAPTTDADGNITAASFLLIGSLFAVFAIPIFVIVHERQRHGRAVQRSAMPCAPGRSCGSPSRTRASGPGCCAS